VGEAAGLVPLLSTTPETELDVASHSVRLDRSGDFPAAPGDPGLGIVERAARTLDRGHRGLVRVQRARQVQRRVSQLQIRFARVRRVVRRTVTVTVPAVVVAGFGPPHHALTGVRTPPITA
jgi:hypothetical protein